MKRFLIAFQEVSYGVVEVYAENEEMAREIAECEGDMHVNKSHMELGEVVREDDIEE